MTLANSLVPAAGPPGEWPAGRVRLLAGADSGDALRLTERNELIHL
ncbi:hypothetical protein [Streptomyces sp. ML-6]|nr:hypothetical protein [Streptomyces sp. ML-6]MDK0523432.1 hypothetical protein [Streptomyces sp. ML-6]